MSYLSRVLSRILVLKVKLQFWLRKKTFESFASKFENPYKKTWLVTIFFYILIPCKNNLFYDSLILFNKIPNNNIKPREYTSI